MTRPRLWFVTPIHGRQALTAICLRQLRRTCDVLIAEGVDATAVIIGDQANLAAAPDLGFATVTRNNDFLGRRYNDGIQLALDPRHNPNPADFVVPIGSDDFIDHRVLLDLPAPNTIVCFQCVSCVREDGQEIAATKMASLGGSGIRIYPRELLEPFGYRPADEDRRSGCDTSIMVRLAGRCRIEYRHLHDAQIVDWKSPGQQLHPYSDSVRLRRSQRATDPFQALHGIYPDEALAEMRDHYATPVGIAA